MKIKAALKALGNSILSIAQDHLFVASVVIGSCCLIGGEAYFGTKCRQGEETSQEILQTYGFEQNSEAFVKQKTEELQAEYSAGELSEQQYLISMNNLQNNTEEEFLQEHATLEHYQAYQDAQEKISSNQTARVTLDVLASAAALAAFSDVCAYHVFDNDFVKFYEVYSAEEEQKKKDKLEKAETLQKQ